MTVIDQHKIPFLIGTCRTRVFGAHCIHNKFNQLWLDIVEKELITPPEVEGVSGYVIEICSLKYNDTALDMNSFISLIKKFNKMIPDHLPVLWISHINPVLSGPHIKELRSHGVRITECNRIGSRVDIENWLAEALVDDDKSLVFNPSSEIKNYDSSTIFKYHATPDWTSHQENKLDKRPVIVKDAKYLDTQHYADEGTEHVIRIHDRIRSITLTHFNKYK